MRSVKDHQVACFLYRRLTEGLRERMTPILTYHRPEEVLCGRTPRASCKREPITVKAVDGVSFAVQKGETFGLVGESGSGKSTVAYTTIGMYRPTAGVIEFRGESLFTEEGRRPLHIKKEIQIVFQDPGSSLNPAPTIRQILELPLQHSPAGRRTTSASIAELLEMVELPADYLYKYPQALSGGEKQIVAIARALATEPSFIILDEPTSALDVSIQGKIINLLIRLQQEFQPVVSVHHPRPEPDAQRGLARGDHVPGQDL